MIWLDGRLVPPERARVDPSDRGLLLGDGLFETVRAADGRAPLLARHLARLREGAAALGIPVPAFDAAAAVAGLLAANGLRDAAVRLTLTRGPGPRGLPPPAEVAPTLLIAAFPPPPPAPPARAVVATGTRRNERSPLSRLKALGYLDQILALREARARGADEALLLNTRDRLACATAANLFVVRGRELATPPVAEGALPGVTRGLVLEAAGELGLEPREEALGAEALARADEVFLTSSLRLVTPVAAVDGLALPAPAPGPAARRVMAALLRVGGAALAAPGARD